MRHVKSLLAPLVLAAFGVALLAATSEPSLGNETVNFSYDPLGRLVKAEHNGDVNNNVLANFSYDRAGNREAANVSGAP